MARRKYRNGITLWLVIALSRCLSHDCAATFVADLLRGDAYEA